MRNKITLMALVLLTFTLSSFRSNSTRADFTGEWVLNKDRIEFGDEPEWVYPPMLAIAQNQSFIQIEWTFLDDKGDKSKTLEKILFDGSAGTTTTPSGKHWTSIVNWPDDKSLIINKGVTTSDDKPYAKVIEKLYFDEDGESLVLQRTIEHEGFTYTISAIYDKKQ